MAQITLGNETLAVPENTSVENMLNVLGVPENAQVTYNEITDTHEVIMPSGTKG